MFILAIAGVDAEFEGDVRTTVFSAAECTHILRNEPIEAIALAFAMNMVVMFLG